MARRALVIDDNAITRDSIAVFLESIGYETLAAERGEPGLSVAATQSPDIIVLDLLMPDRDGSEVCRTLRQSPETNQIPVIIITGSDDPALSRKACAAGAQACVPKPFRRDALIAAIQAVVASVPREQF